MYWTWWAVALHYSQHSRHGVIAEWSRAGEYLDRDHRERENVRFLAKFLPIQYFWRSPSRAGATLERGTPDRIQVLSNRGEAKACDACVTEVVHKDVRPLEVPMDHVAGVEVTETFGEIK